MSGEKRLETCLERVAELNRELDSLLYAISHDLQAPLRSIDGFSQAVLEDYAHKLDSEGQDYLHRVRQAGKKIDAYVNALLMMSRQTREDITLQEVDLGAMAREILREFQEHEAQRNVDILIQDGLTACFDPAMARTLLEKLLHNAWKFSSRTDKARIEVGMRMIGPDRCFFVRDNGVGFDMEYARSRLFGAFQRMHADDEYPGPGTGLATARRIVNRHGGRIWAESSPGQGTIIFFTAGTPEGCRVDTR